MSVSYKPYPKYKASAVEWLGELPLHWQDAVIKRGYNVCLGKMLRTAPSTPADSLEFYLRAANLNWSGVRNDDIKQMWFSPDEKIKLRLKAGDLLISEGGDVGRSSIWNCELPECYIQNAVNRVRGRKENSTRFMFYWVQTIKQHGLIDVICNKSTIAHYTAEKVAETECLLPSPSEQYAIASFLDRETGKIDRMIEKQERMIELLKEKRQAVISHAVTKGLDPKVPMKDSGIEWLGEIPEHWISMRYKMCTTRVDVGIAEAATHAYADEGVPIVRSTNVKENYLRLDDVLYITEEFAQKNHAKFLYKNDVVTVRTGYPGISAVIPEDLDLSQCFTLLMATPKQNSSPEFLSYFLNADIGKKFFALHGWGSAQKNISVPILQNVPIALPPLKEQKRVVEFIKKSVAKTDNLIAKAEQAIGLMKERRTALISAAVTGKIDVRNDA